MDVKGLFFDSEFLIKCDWVIQKIEEFNLTMDGWI